MKKIQSISTMNGFGRCQMKAKFDISGLDKLEMKLEQIVSDEGIVKRGIYVGAGMLADKIKSNLAGVLSGNSSGALIESLGISKIDAGGGIANVSIGFDGYDAKGTANQLKARCLESGTSKLKKRQFIRPAVNSVKSAMTEAMTNEVLKQLEEKLQ